MNPQLENYICPKTFILIIYYENESHRATIVF